MDSKRLVDAALDRVVLVSAVGAILGGSYLAELREGQDWVVLEELVLLLGYGLVAVVMRPPAGARASNWFVLGVLVVTASRMISVPMFLNAKHPYFEATAPVWIVLTFEIVQTVLLMLAFARLVRHQNAHASAGPVA